MKTKICFKCKIEKSIEQFYKHPQMTDGVVNKCKECNKKDNSKNWWDKREEKKEYDVYRQRYSITRIFNHRYNLIKRRCVKGRANGEKYKVTGLPFLSKQDWIKWCYEEKNYKQFILIYNDWVQSNFEKKKAPSIDRIDNNKSYFENNIQWLSQSKNSQKQ